MLEAHGYEVLYAEDGFEGLAALKKAPPDLFISDLRMSNMNGFEFLSVVRRRFPIIPVVVISSGFWLCQSPKAFFLTLSSPKALTRYRSYSNALATLYISLPRVRRQESQPRLQLGVMNNKDTVAVTCSEYLRTFPVAGVAQGLNETECDFCACMVGFEIIDQTFAGKILPAVLVTC